MQRAPNNNNKNSNTRVFYNSTVTPSDVVTVERQFHNNTHLSSGQRGYARRGRPNHRNFSPSFPFLVAQDVEAVPTRRGPRQNNHPSDNAPAHSQIHSHHVAGPNPNCKRNRQNQQQNFPPNFPFVPASDDWQYRGPRCNNKQNFGQTPSSGPNQRGNWRGGNRQHNQSNRGGNKNAASFAHSTTSSNYHGGRSHGSSSGCSSSDSVQSQVELPIEEHEREAVAIIKETINIIKEEKDLYFRRSKALRKPCPHYECLEGAMIRREQIQHESYEKHGDRHEIDDHEVIYGHKKEYVDMLRERRIHISKWLLNNRIEAQVEYDCDADAEPLQINDEETDETKAEGSKEEEEKSDPVPA
ncbi:hypothetical protein PRIPAC_75122 [Pristionchus pacificus]|uniref:Uncharacterized protein n=1 Tax=Pristionchus pacificus TaxID=54126 RepID=A0A2A6C8H0_PRIPA|nr:hypothetical protein PRIPAC_75122 [Pristionchus pacificus]|eukprot:PDM74407.1 hypothetical protein PRIPAC_41763 [Pristionchus pacificus]